MDILFVSPSSNPLNGQGWGALQRTNLLFEACVQLGPVDVISFVDGIQSASANCNILHSKSNTPNVNTKRIKHLLRLLLPFQPYAMFPKDKQCSDIIKSYVNKKNYDIIICRYIPDAMKCGLFDYADRLVIDIDDNPYDIERSAVHKARTILKLIYHLYRLSLMSMVIKRIQHRCRFTFYSNPSQAIYPNSAYLPNIPFYEYEMHPADFTTTSYRLLFVGNMSYGPNIEGIDHFIQCIFPFIREIIPSIELHLVGGCNQPDYLDRWKRVQGIDYMGFVDDLKKEYSESRVVIAPIYEGAGTNIKVLEAMKMKRPCVTTQFGYRGFSCYFHHGKELLVSKDDRDFIKNVVDVILNESINHMISERAYETVNKEFSRSSFYSIVANCIL